MDLESRFRTVVKKKMCFQKSEMGEKAAREADPFPPPPPPFPGSYSH